MQNPDFDNAMRLAREPTRENFGHLMGLLESLELDYSEREVMSRVPVDVTAPDGAGGPAGAPEVRNNVLMSLNWIYGALLIVYLAAGDLDNARFLSKRIPGPMKNGPELAAAIRLLMLLWNRENEQFYALAAQAQWTEHLAPLVGLAVQMTRERTVSLLAKAYSTIKVSNAAKLLGLSDEAKLVADLQAVGWTVDQDGFLIAPPSAAATGKGAAGKTEESAAAWSRVQDLAKIVVSLELQ